MEDLEGDAPMCSVLSRIVADDGFARHMNSV